MILPDINVWIALAFDQHMYHSRAKSWYDSVPDTESFAFCRHTQKGFLRISSTPNVTKMSPLTMDEVWAIHDSFFDDSRVTFLDDPPGLEATWRKLTRGSRNAVSLWADAYLAAFAIESGSQLVTFDTGFRQFPGLNLRLLP